MDMHATSGAATRQQTLIRQGRFVAQCRQEAGLTGVLAWHHYLFGSIMLQLEIFRMN